MKIIRHLPQYLLSCLLVSCLVLSAQQVQAQYTTIPDTTFELFLVNQNIDSDGMVNGQVLTSDIAGVTSLELPQGGGSLYPTIHDLTGIEDFSSLTYLLLSSYPMTTLDLSNNTNLQKVKARLLSTPLLDLSALHNLDTLIIHSGAIDSLILPQSASNLRSIEISSNLGDFDLSTSTALSRLHVSSSSLHFLDLSALSNLEDLFSYSAYLDSIRLPDSAGNLQYITFSAGDIRHLDLSACSQLRSLSVNATQLSELDARACTALQYVSLTSNPLQQVELSNSLERLEISIAPDSLLQALDISSCHSLSHLTLSGMRLEKDSFKFSTTSLDYLFLYHVDIHQADLDLSSAALLREIHVQETNVRQLDLSASTNLYHVRATNNRDLYGIQLHSGNLQYLQTFTNAPDLHLCFVDSLDPTIPTNILWNIGTATYSDNCKGYSVIGQVALDTNNNCQLESGEPLLANRPVEFQKAGHTPIVAMTGNDGTYRAYLDTGTYTATLILPNLYQQACVNSQTIVVDTNQVVDTLDWVVYDVIECPSMWVEIGSPFIRATTLSYYNIYYCNHGTLAADSAYIEVELDPALTYNTATIALTSQNGQTLRFDIGQVGIGQCGTFTVFAQLDTSAFMGQTHCTEAHIYPDSVCNSSWTGADLEVEGVCLGDSIAFTILNTAAAMSQVTNYFVFEDNIMMRQGTVQLGAGASQVIHQHILAGKTYRLTVEQETGFPAYLGDSIATAALEGCKPLPNGSFNTGFITQFPNGDGAPFVAIDCQQNVASYDPNDKAAQPEGYDSLYHYITPTTRLNYKIRFQNTGTDTAFNIVILDTISPFLDVSSIQMGASSHAYTWSISNGNVLRVAFNDIKLPDSTVNEPLSNGFFYYQIEQQANNPLDSVIYNTAAIYFDFNPPIFTNTTFHTLGENFIPIQLTNTQVLDKAIDLNIYPNPFHEFTTLSIQNGQYQSLQVELYSLTGVLIQQVQGEGNQVQLSGAHLPAGMYVYRLRGDGKYLATGTVVVH